MNTSHTGPSLTASLLLVFLSLPCLSQSLDKSSVSGSIRDRDGAPVESAEVALKPKGAGVRISATTRSDGTYRIEGVPPGEYLISLTAEGYTSLETTSFDVPTAVSLRFDTVLAPMRGSAYETVVIEAASAVTIETARTTVSSSIGSVELDALPLLSSDPLRLLHLLGAVSEEPLAVRELADDAAASYRVTPIEQGFASISGGVSYSNNVTVDGLDNNDDRTARERFTMPTDSVSEVQVVRNQFSAEYGRASGSRINLVSRSGSQKYRGQFSVHLRDERLDANSWSNNRRGLARPRLRQRQFTGSLSGPLGSRTKERSIFFFLGLERERRDDDTLIDTFLPVAGNPGYPTAVPNGEEIFCDADDDSDCLGDPPTAAWMFRHTARIRTPDDSLKMFARLDRRGSRLGTLNLTLQRGLRSARSSSAPRITRTEEAIQSRRHENFALSASLSRPFGATRLNDLRIQVSHLSPGFATSSPRNPVVLIGYRNPFAGNSETLTIGNSTASSLQNFAESRRESRVQVSDTLTLASHSRTSRLGLDLHMIDSRAKALTYASGTFNFPSMLDFRDNLLSRFRQTFGNAGNVKNAYLGAFLNEEHALRPNLNLTFGMRYESESAVRDRDNFGPRFGAAWDPFSNGRGVVRFGYGIFFNRVLLRTVADYARTASGQVEGFDSNLIGTTAGDTRRNTVLRAIAARFPQAFPTASDLQTLIGALRCGTSTCSPMLGFTGGSTSSTPSRTIEPGIKIPKSHQANIGVEFMMGKGLILETNLTLNRTVNLWREQSTNLPILPAGYSDWTEFLLANPHSFRNTNGTLRSYFFYLGAATSGGGVTTQPGGTSSCPTTSNTICWVNLNSISTSATAPSSAGPDSVNSIGSPLGIAWSAIQSFRPDPLQGTGGMIVSRGNAFYRGMVAELRSAPRPVLGSRMFLRAAYTLSKMEDDGLNNTSNAQTNGRFDEEWARSLSDRLHRISFYAVIESPKRFGGLQFAPTFRYGSSAPVNIGTGTDRNLDGGSTDRPNFDGDISLLGWRRHGSDSAEHLLSLFNLSPIGSRGGNLPRNAAFGPGFVTMDMSVLRRFQPRRWLTLTSRLEASNVINRTNFSYGAEYVDFKALGPQPTESQLEARRNFLTPSRTLRPREVRVSLKVEF